MRSRKETKGALPVPYIVALIIAILVIALLIVWFFLIYGQSTNTSSETICRGKEISYCTAWAATGYNPDSMPSKQDFSLWAPDCAAYSWAKSVSPTACKGLLNPIGTQTTTQ